MPVRQIDFGTAEYKKAVQLRYEILRKPLHLSFSAEELEKERKDLHIGAFDDDELLACCLLTVVDENSVRLRQMAVQNRMQKKGIGAALMRYAEDIAADKGFKEITMHARKTATGFYEKLGYKICGNEFMEVSIPHYIMKKNLEGLRY